jgi:hypothetical protein
MVYIGAESRGYRDMRLCFCAVLTLFFCLTISAGADEPTDPVKWSQLPYMEPWGYDFSSETGAQGPDGVLIGSMVADDFLCSSPLPVVDLHWWGSYYTPSAARWPYSNSNNWPDPTVGNDVPPDLLVGFLIEFYSDIPANTDPDLPWSHPGECLYEEFIPISDITEALYGTVVHIGGVEENVWQYNCKLPVPFPQDPEQEPQDLDGDGAMDGTVYWLKIQARHESRIIQWGWHEADSLWHDNAVQWWPPNQTEPYWELLTNKDMAFELTVIPEPSLLLIAGLGVLALLRRSRAR